MKQPIYLDYNASTPIDPEVLAAMQPYLSDFYGNPSSTHAFGIQARKAVEGARCQVADLLNCYPDEIVFTSGGTESNNFAIKGAALQNKDKGRHIITSNIEHPAVAEVCRFLEDQGFIISRLPVDEAGILQPEELEKAISKQTILITVMHANNEIGSIQPIAELARIAKKHNVLFHTDAAQSAGKIKTDVNELGVDMLSLAGHKMYAPKGIGALFIRRGTTLQQLMHGAGHEHRLRAGTENVAQIVAFGKAAEIARRDLKSNSLHMQRCRDLLHDTIQTSLPEIHLNGHPERRLPNTLSISFPGLEANTILDELHEIAASAGAACHAGQVNMSAVLEALQLPAHQAMGTIRFSTGKFNTEEEILQAAKAVIGTVNRLQPGDHVPTPTPDGNEVKLTRFTHGMGCACKIRPLYLEELLKNMPVIVDPMVLVSADKADDAAVYKINDETAIVQTVDFFTPIADNPYDFGAIAAANALSDIYAMGAKPLFALNIVGFPTNRLPMQVLNEILRGAYEKAAEAGIPILGGHTVEDPEPKFGMVVSGLVHPNKVITNAGTRTGDALVLTKPIGSGIIATAMKRGLSDETTTLSACHVMSLLNARAAQLMEKYPVNACTDISGFGLLGHLREMTTAAGVDVQIEAQNIPLIEGTYQLAVAGAIPGGTYHNLEYVKQYVQWATEMPEIMKAILCDPQTSGGLLIAIPHQYAGEFTSQLNDTSGLYAVTIGIAIKKGNGMIYVNY